jgi:hypothetical protein
MSTLNSIGISVDEKLEDSAELNSNSSVAKIKAGTASKVISASELELVKSSSIKSSESDTVKLIAGTEKDESYPSMVFNSYNGVVAYEVEEDAKNRVYLKKTKDFGNTWSAEPFTFNITLDRYNNKYTDISTTQPDISLVPFERQGYGAIVSPLNNSAVYSYFIMYDISDEPDTWRAFTLDWTNVTYNSTLDQSQGFWGFSNPQIIPYEDSTTPWVMALIGNTNYTGNYGEGPATNTPMFSFRDLNSPETDVAIAWFPEITNCRNVDIANDYGDDTIYGVCEIENGTNQDLLFFKGNPTKWYYDEDLINRTITSDENLLNPQIFVKGSNIYIIAETDTLGIVMYHSTNGGNTWIKKNVTSDLTPSPATPKYPNIKGNNTQIAITYVEEGNISLTNSSDLGENWSAPIQLNDIDGTVVEDYRQSDIADMEHIVWADNRNISEKARDIYAYIGTPPTLDVEIVNGSVNLSLGFDFKFRDQPIIPTKNMIEFTVRNVGSFYVEDVFINITYTCDNGTPNATNYPVYLPFLNGSGAERRIKQPLFRLAVDEMFSALIAFAGVDNITVTAELENDVNLENNLAYLSKESGLYSEIFPKLAFLEPILERFK